MDIRNAHALLCDRGRNERTCGRIDPMPRELLTIAIEQARNGNLLAPLVFWAS